MTQNVIFPCDMTETDILALKQVFVDEVNGSDESGSGSKSAPYKTPLHAVIQVGGTDQALFMIKKEGSTEYTEIAKSAAKKLQKTLDKIRKNEAKAASISCFFSNREGRRQWKRRLWKMQVYQRLRRLRFDKPRTQEVLVLLLEDGLLLFVCKVENWSLSM